MSDQPADFIHAQTEAGENLLALAVFLTLENEALRLLRLDEVISLGRFQRPGRGPETAWVRKTSIFPNPRERKEFLCSPLLIAFTGRSLHGLCFFP